MRASLVAIGLWACAEEPVEPPPRDPPVTYETVDPPPTVATPTTTITTAGGTTLSASCAITDNALRFLCTVAVDPPQPVEVRFARTDGTGAERVHASDAPAAEHQVPLYFLAPETSYDVVVSTRAGTGDATVATVVTTGVPPQPVRVSLDVVGTASAPFVGGQNPCGDAIATIFDTATGEVVWFQVLVPDAPMGLFGMVQFTDRHTVLALADNERAVVEYDLAGNLLLRFDDGLQYVEELHHDLFERNGLYYLLFSEGNSPTLDGFLVLDGAGVEVARWRAATALDIPGNAFGDWMHTNTIWVDSDGDVLLSSFEQNTLLEIEGDLASPDFGTANWAMDGGNDGGFGQDFAIDWGAFQPGWENQHNVHRRADGRLMMFDNEHERALVVAYDEAAGTAAVELEYDIGNGSCIPQGTAAETGTGNALVGCSGDTITEVDDAGAEVWRGTAECAFADASVMRWYPLEGW